MVVTICLCVNVRPAIAGADCISQFLQAHNLDLTHTHLTGRSVLVLTAQLTATAAL